jgi:hypothetical protein
MTGTFVSACRGALAGVAATWLMDQVTTGMAASASKEDADQESDAQVNGQSSVANLLDRIERVTDRHVPDDARPQVLTAIHYALGVVPGAVYGALGAKGTMVAAGRGALYGLVLWAANDEYLNTTLGLAGPVDAYPISTHLRGFVGHVVLGVSTDTVIGWLGG